MVTQVGTVCVFLLICCSSALEDNATVAFYGRCSSKDILPSNKQFDERKITYLWRATHFSSTSKTNFPQNGCHSLTIQSVPTGLLSRSVAMLGNNTYYDTIYHNRTETPGFYEGGRGYRDLLFYLHHGYLLISMCSTNGLMSHDSYNSYEILIFSRRHTTPGGILRHFIHYLNEHGILVNYFYPFPSTTLCN